VWVWASGRGRVLPPGTVGTPHCFVVRVGGFVWAWVYAASRHSGYPAMLRFGIQLVHVFCVQARGKPWQEGRLFKSRAHAHHHLRLGDPSGTEQVAALSSYWGGPGVKFDTSSFFLGVWSQKRGLRKKEDLRSPV